MKKREIEDLAIEKFRAANIELVRSSDFTNILIDDWVEAYVLALSHIKGDK